MTTETKTARELVQERYPTVFVREEDGWWRIWVKRIKKLTDDEFGQRRDSDRSFLIGGSSSLDGAWRVAAANEGLHGFISGI